ncbi:unnamed protein product [Paramecium octaurelia]|uniref:Uncharacterized protein n=1 Tax=Paramecium octaurelia TaxID=43137 RepID=A0A8S1RYG7_PAROT|nr:unnamed protein product [Paramecium octaurelia]
MLRIEIDLSQGGTIYEIDNFFLIGKVTKDFLLIKLIKLKRSLRSIKFNSQNSINGYGENQQERIMLVRGNQFLQQGGRRLYIYISKGSSIVGL